MTTKPKVLKYRVDRLGPLDGGLAPNGASPADPGPAGPSAQPAGTSAPPAAANSVAESAAESAPGALPPTGAHAGDVESEGLTGRQLRMARRVAARHGLSASSDFDAVRQLRARGIDPFRATSILDLDTATGDAVTPPPGPTAPPNLPQTVPDARPALPAADRPPPSGSRDTEISRIQRDIARRRRRNFLALMARLAVFVGLPTAAVGWYYYRIATPMFATNSEFVIQQADSAGGAGLGGLFQGTSMATQQDSMTVQAYLTSRSALARLDAEHGFRDHFSNPGIDPLQRLAPGSTNEAAYNLYTDHVRISYDPSEGIIRMEVIAADPETSQRFSQALIGYAEDQVDQLTLRKREDAMADARQSYEEAEKRRTEALSQWLAVQEDVGQIDPVGETAALTQQISRLEIERQELQLQLDSRLSVERPNQAQVNALRMQIANIEDLISSLRADMTADRDAGASLAARNNELRMAEENYTFQTVIVQQALQQMEMARIEANRQVRYLSLGVEPIPPDEATYPRAFENTVVAFLIFSGIYLMLSITIAVLREQVTS